MTKNKGFTLVELLAIIVVLIAILWIAVPRILAVIENAKMEAFRDTAYLIVHTGELFESDNPGSHDFYYNDGTQYNSENYQLEHHGGTDIVAGAVYLRNNGNVVAALHNGTYCATKDANTKLVEITTDNPSDCLALDVIQTESCDSWATIATRYNIELTDLLAANGNPAPGSSTCGLDINIPIYADGGGNDGGIYYKTYYSLGYVVDTVSLPYSYDYTIDLGNLPLDIDDIDTVTVTAQSIYDGLGEFQSYIVKRNMGEVVFAGGDPTEIDLDMASTFDDHAATSSNMTAEGVNVTCDETKCSAHIYATVNNLNNIQTYEINGNDVAYTPIKFTVQFNGPVACPYEPTPASCFVHSGATITDYNYTTPGCPSNVVIPSSLDGTTITTIGGSAFASNNLTCVKLPNTITTIGGDSFKNNLIASINIPNSVSSIDTGAFSTNHITTVTIPSSITSIGYSAFAGNALTGGIVWNSNIAGTGGYSLGPFNEVTNISSVTIGSNVDHIPINLFSGATFSFTSYTIPSQITSIGESGFRYTNLTSIDLNNVTSIGARAFNETDLTSIDLSGVASIGDECFRNTEISGLVIPSSLTSIGTAAFYNINITGVTVPSTVTSIGYTAFGGNALTDGFVWNSNIASTGWYSLGPFNEATNISSVTIGSNVDHIPNNLFSGATFAFTSYTIPSQITSIGESGFRYTNLTSIDLNNVTSIGARAFNETDLTSIDLSGVVSVGDECFRNTPLGSLVIPNSMTTIGTAAFYNTDITSITVPSSITSIGYNAFGANALTGGVVWNSNIASTGWYGLGPFNEATSIGSITFGGGVDHIPGNLFSGANFGFTSYSVPSQITNVNGNGFKNTNLTTVSIPNSVTNIGTDAFNTSSLTSATIDNSVGNVTLGSTPFGGVTPTYLR